MWSVIFNNYVPGVIRGPKINGLQSMNFSSKTLPYENLRVHGKRILLFNMQHVINNRNKGNDFNNNDKYPEERKELQDLVGEILMTKAMIENLFPILLVYLIGPWIDKHGQKMPIIVVAFCFMAKNIFLTFSSFGTDTEGSLTGAWTVALSTSLIISISGSQPCFMMAAYSYAITSVKSDLVTTRLGVVNTAFYLGMFFGFYGGAVLSSYHFSFTFMFFIGVILEAFAVIFLYLQMQNRVLANSNELIDKSKLDVFADLFHIDNVKDSISTIIFAPNGIRMQIWIMLFVHACAMGSMYGEATISHLFYHNVINWNDTAIGDYYSFKIVVGFFSNLISTLVLNHFLKLPDPLSGVIASVSNLVASLLLIFASSSSIHFLFISPIVNVFSSPLYVIPRSTISKLVAPTDIGKANAFIASFECTIPILISPIYFYIYTTFPGGSVFIISVLFMIPSIMIYGWLIRNQKINHVD